MGSHLHRFARIATGIAVVAALWLLSPLATRAAGVVTNCDDHGTGSLRHAIAGGGTVTFAPGVNCGGASAIVLTSGTLLLTANTTIDASNHRIVVDGGCTVSGAQCQIFTGVGVFAVNAGVTASLTGLTIQHGSGSSCGAFTCGGGIYASGAALSVMNCTFIANTVTDAGSGIYNSGGTLTVTNSIFFGNGLGAAISNWIGGTLMVTNSIFSDNTGDIGGIDNVGMLTVTGSTFSGNASDFGGGIANDSDLSIHGTATVANSTITGNSAGSATNTGHGGGIANSGTLTVTNSTITGNTASGPGISDGGGISNVGTLTLVNTIVAGNAATNGATGPDIGGNANVDTTNSRNNLIGTGGSGGVVNGVNGNQVGVANPGLGPLGDNGGPTQTIPLLTGSPAIAHGNPAACAAAPVNGRDQRAVGRPVTLCAIGAFEPLLSAIAPTTGGITGGTTVTLTGAGYGFGTTVTIGGVPCTLHIVSSTMLTCTTGAHAAGAVDVVVTVFGQTGALPGGYTYALPNPLPGVAPPGGVPGSPSPLPGARQQGGVSGAPNPLPSPRP